MAIYDLRLGRIQLPTVTSDVSESLGDSLEVVGSGITAGERKPKPFAVEIPVYGDPRSTDPYSTGQRLRRQIRSLIDNPDARVGVYFQWDVDTEQSGWLIVGGGELDYAPGGMTMSDYLLKLSDCYRVGQPRTHRPASQLVALDRRQASVFRDTLKTITGTDWSSLTPTVVHYLPVGATDVLGPSRRPVSFGTSIASADGSIPVVTSSAVAVYNGAALSYELADADRRKGDVVIFDRRGLAAPTGVNVVATDMQAAGWEEVYGNNYPWSSADLPVLDNRVCRLRWDATSKVLALDGYDSPNWTERGRIALFGAPTSTTLAQLDELVGLPTVLEWTPARAVISFNIRRAADPGMRAQVIVTLQRGWRGPRVEMYAGYYPGQTVKPGLSIRWVPVSTGTQTVTAGSGTLATTPNDYGAWSVQTANWVDVTDGTAAGDMTLAVMRAAVRLWTRNDTTSFPSGTRKSIEVEARYNTTLAGYVSAHMALGHSSPSGFGLEALAECRAIPSVVSR